MCGGGGGMSLNNTTTVKGCSRHQEGFLIMMEELADDKGVCLLTCGFIFRG